MTSLNDMKSSSKTKPKQCIEHLHQYHTSEANADSVWLNTINSAQDAILVYDEKLNVTNANQSAAVFLGQTIGQLIGKSHTQLFHQPSLSADECPVEKIQKTNKQYETEIQVVGTEKWLKSSAYPIFDGRGDISGVIHFVRDITENKCVQDMLRQSKERLELVLKGADLGMWDWNLRTGEVIFNQRWAQMIDYELNEIEPHVSSWEKLVHPDDMPETMKRLNAHLEGKTGFYESEHRMRTKTGEWKWILDRGRIVQWDQNGKPLRMSGTHLDITEQKKITRELEENRSNLRSFFDSVENLLSVMDMQGTIIEVNQSLKMRLGYSGKELIGQNILNLHPEQYHQQAKAIVQDMIQGKTNTCPLPLITKDGQFIPAETYVVRGLWSGQEVFFGVSKDISDLKESEEKFSKAFQGSATLMAISTIEDGRFIEVNDRFLRTLGYQRDEVIGKTSEELGLFMDLSQREAVKRKVQKQGYARDYELSILTKQGDVRCAIFNADRLQLQNNQYILTVANDITDLRNNQKKLHDSQQRLRQARNTLEKKVQQRTAQLQQSQQQLRELYSRVQSTQEKDRKHISREIHDELGTALTALKYDLAWIQRKLINPSAVIVKKISTMSGAIDSIIETVQKICTQLRPGLLDDMGLAAAMEWQANKFAKMAEIACKTDFDEMINLNQDHATLLFRIFQELLTNILRHANASRIQISLKQHDSKAILEVTDNGVGITKEQISDNNSLGLIGIHERVTIYGGSFEIKGTAKKGTIAKVILPIEKGLNDDKSINL